MRWMLRCGLTMLVVLTAIPAMAQVSFDTASLFRRDSNNLFFGPVRRADVSFNRLLSLYEWKTFVDYQSDSVSLPSAAYYQMHLDGTSRLRQDNGSRTTEGTAFLELSQPLLSSGSFSPFLMLYGTSYTNSLASVHSADVLAFNRQADGFAVAGVRSVLPETNISVTAGAGLARQSQPFTSTYGLMTMGGVVMPRFKIGDLSVFSDSMTLDERFYKERSQRYSSDHLTAAASSGFGEFYSDGRNDAILKLGLLRRDFFLALDSVSQPVKQERTEMSLSLIDSLSYPLVVNALTGTVDLEFEPRSVSRTSDISTSGIANSSISTLSSLLVPNDINSLRLGTFGRLVYMPRGLDNFSLQAQMRYEERNEDVTLRSAELVGVDPARARKIASILNQASYSSRTTQSTLTANYRPSLRDSLQLDASTRILNYDTPSEDNSDDHDELISSLRLLYGRYFSEELGGFVSLSASRTHLVYLKSDRSAQNNVTRSLDLTTQTNYFSPSYFGTLRADVFANYTVLDYLDVLPILQTVGSYVLRGLEIHDSSSLALPFHPFDFETPLRLEGYGDIRVSERGNFQSTGFSEKRDTRITELSAEALLTYDANSSATVWSLKAGVRGFWLSRYGRSELSSIANQSFDELAKQDRLGPIAILDIYRPTQTGPMLSGSFWYSIIKSQTFDVPTLSRLPEVECHLECRWNF